jgi:DNA-directed RNA polymerase III subunit RPC2
LNSTTHERKVKTYVLMSKGKMYLHQNGVSEDIPIVVLFKAMGVQSDREIYELIIGQKNFDEEEEEDDYGQFFDINLEECSKMDIFTQTQALEWMGSKVRIPRRWGTPGGQRRLPAEEAKEFISDFILAHVPVINDDFRPKIMYCAIMARRVLMAKKDPKLVDDRDYVGNKRLEL